ncbi:hypothetical protein HNP52_000032 [Sphingomonas kyeonggiensis]|uniref:DUF4440 domain-containing protein n=1 Tax=Sphingomonas kyeonggiensis TaxID=1268553 RepID=A0A7W7JX58_9SPHN|nr:hypothetical protein [Sphingomonas kyeonggiensis]MBB4836981.1 hypothetical protein [Sphingomonas kyeonggiensis]
MKHVFIFAAVVLTCAPCAVAAQAAPTATLGDAYLGSWESNDLDEIRNWNDGACAAILTTRRKYAVERRPGSGALSILYMNQTWGHIVHNAGMQCKLDGQAEPGSVFLRIRSWQGDPRILADASLAFDGYYSGCHPIGCEADPQIFKGDFHARLSIDGAHLIDTGDGQTVAWRTRYWSVANLADAKRDALRAVNEVIGHLGADEPDTFIQDYLPRLPRNGSPLATIRQLRRLTRHIVSRDPIDQIIIDQAKRPEGYGPVEMILSLANAKLDNGASALETTLLTREDGAWKLHSYQLN